MKSVDISAWPTELHRVLAQVPFIADMHIAEEPASPILADGEVRLRVHGEPWTLVIEAKESAEPRRVREAAAQLQRHLQSTKRKHVYGVLVAPFISDQARSILSDEGLGWLDLAGNCRLSFGGVHIDRARTDKNPFTTKREQGSLFAPKSSRLLRLMLSRPGPWKVADLSEQAGVSLGQVSKVRQALIEKEWASAEPGGGIRLRQPAAVLNAWREVARPPEPIRRGYTPQHGKSLDECLTALFARPKAGRVLLASHSVARRLAPFARVAGEYFYADPKGQREIEAALELSPAERGENVTILQAPDDGLWSDAIALPSGMKGTSLVQTYLDLWAAGDRSAEAAEHLRREKIEPLFETLA